ncbi:hypothetical protein R1sor_007355 [Riccia sorocarpa]|uniref:Reverse transcriptase domain-containing protein n=1 Tax=Riccia sorocarpa TaxID=122646 RepID=A0ABD3HTN2_9MARC
MTTNGPAPFRLQSLKENVGGPMEIPPLAKVLLVLETLTGSVAELKSEVVAMRRELVTHNVEVKQMRRTAGAIESEVQKIHGMILVIQGELSKCQPDLSPLLTAATEYKDVVTEVSKAQLSPALSELRLEIHELQLETKTQSEAINSRLNSVIDSVKAVGSTPQTGFTLVDLDTRMKTYADVTRTAQSEVMLEQEREKNARDARAKNLRIVGLEETEDENTKDKVLEFFQGVLHVEPAVDQAWRIGRKDRVWHPRRFNNGRGFGGVALWKRDEVQLDITVENTDPHNHFICFRITGACEPVFLIIAYYPPSGAPVYSYLGNSADPFASLTSTVLEVQDKGPLWVLGDFNGRTGAAQSLDLGSKDDRPWANNHNHRWDRISEDDERNGLTNPFLQMVSIGGLTILNGTAHFRQTGGFTCATPNGNSTVDYLLASRTARDKVTTFQLGPWSPESDHCPLLCSFILPQLSKRKSRPCKRPLLLDRSKKDEYELAVKSRLLGGVESSTLPRLLMRAAADVFEVRSCRRQTWYDEDCRAARVKAMSQPDRKSAFRVYTHFIRAKKRRYLQEQQEALTMEFLSRPQEFWRRLRPRHTCVDLSEPDLLLYVKHLYFVPDAGQMPNTAGPGCIFTVAEVANEISRLQASRAADMNGVTAELLRWGGEELLTIVTTLINTAGSSGLPTDWTHRRVVPLYKSGPRSSASSYRTIMIANLFAKLLGRLLDSRLSEWCESRQLRAPVQGGFRKDHSPLDHTLVLRVLCEDAKRKKRPFFAIFIDFTKAFDLVSRELLWKRLEELGVPADLLRTIARLYQHVRVMANTIDPGIESTLGVIQGCPLSSTLFGVFIDNLFWHEPPENPGVQIGNSHFRMLLFADDVVLFANDPDQLRAQISSLESFCAQYKMKVNLSKTNWLCVGGGQQAEFLFDGQPITRTKVYRYLGVEFASNLSWNSCNTSRVTHGFRALYSLRNKCHKVGLTRWRLRRYLFSSLVQASLLYGAQTWGPALPKTSWSRIESVHKIFLQLELGLRPQIPYVILLAETGRLPVEAEALLLTLDYIYKLRAQDHTRLPYQAMMFTYGSGWYADVCCWALRWDFPEHSWGDLATMHTRFSEIVVKRLWASPSARQSYYLRDINRMTDYKEQSYLDSGLPIRTHRLVARYRTSSHNLRVEEGRWILLDYATQPYIGLKAYKLQNYKITNYNGSGFNPRFWGEWKTEEVKLVRDEECTDRIKYKTETRQIDGGAEVFVSRLWSGKQVPPLVGFGALLEGDDGVYRAGIEIGRRGFTRQSSSDTEGDPVVVVGTTI